MNGSILQYLQNSADTDTIAICDSRKCSSPNPGVVISSVEGQCDDRRAQDYLEINVSARRGGSINLTCPDITYVADIACDARDLGSGGTKLESQGIGSIDKAGPLLEVHFLPDTFASCSIVCEDPFHQSPKLAVTALS